MMKKIIFVFFFACSSFSFSQELYEFIDSSEVYLISILGKPEQIKRTNLSVDYHYSFAEYSMIFNFRRNKIFKANVIYESPDYTKAQSFFDQRVKYYKRIGFKGEVDYYLDAMFNKYDYTIYMLYRLEKNTCSVTISAYRKSTAYYEID